MTGCPCLCSKGKEVLQKEYPEEHHRKQMIQFAKIGMNQKGINTPESTASVQAKPNDSNEQIRPPDTSNFDPKWEEFEQQDALI